MNYRPEIDGLRALAVIPVVLFHAAVPGFGGGFVGVDVFFVISGYLITHIILREQRDREFTILNFYERRARRLLPALFSVMAVSIVVAWFVLPQHDLQAFFESVVAAMLFGSNFLFWTESGYFGRAAELTPLLHTWSLAVEEQFYLLYPLYLVIVMRFERKWIVATTAALALISFLMCDYLSSRGSTAAFFLLPPRSWELASGAMIALFGFYCSGFYARLTSHRLVNETVTAAGVVMIVLSVALLDSSVPFPGVSAIPSVLGAVLIVAFCRADGAFGKILSSPPLVRIGLVSYSIYLVHQPLLVFARYTQKDHELGFVLTVILIAASIVLGWLLWLVIERPFRRRTIVPTRQFAVTTLAIATIVFGIGAGGAATSGFFSLRHSDPVLRSFYGTATYSPMRRHCHTEGTYYKQPAAACVYFDKQASWAVMGDSHGVELAYGLALQLKETPEGVQHFTFGSCRPRARRARPRRGCEAWSNEVIDYIERRRNLKTVVLTYRLAHYLRHRGGGPDAITELNRIIDIFVAAGKRVIVVLQAPEPGSDVRNLIFSGGPNASRLVSSTRSAWEAYTRRFREVVMRSSRNVAIVDPSTTFCDTAHCYAGTRWYLILFRQSSHVGRRRQDRRGSYHSGSLRSRCPLSRCRT